MDYVSLNCYINKKSINQGEIFMGCKFNFDEVIDRKNTNSVKHDFHKASGMPEHTRSFWIADMDFQVAETITEAIIKQAKHGIYGYSESAEAYNNAVFSWFKNKFGFEPKAEWLVKTPCVVVAVCVAIRAFTNEDDAILVQPPVYYPFEKSILSNNRKFITNPLVLKDGKYSIDFNDFEQKIIENKIKLFILCSPHNPVGRVWSVDELEKLGEICIKHNVLIISDEIHCDFVYEGYKHHMFASLKPEFAERTITCTAPSKTFNLAGLQTSNIFIPNEEIRNIFIKEYEKLGNTKINTMGLVATQAAYETGGEWLDRLLNYLTENLNFVRTYLQENIPVVKLIEPQGTYLLWLDFSALCMEDCKLHMFLADKGGIWFDKGARFGEGGSGFMRFNIATPRSVLKECLDKLAVAVKEVV